MTDEQRRTEPINVEQFEGHTPGPWGTCGPSTCVRLFPFGYHEPADDQSFADFQLALRAPSVLADLIATRRERDEARAEIERLRGLVRKSFDEGLALGDGLVVSYDEVWDVSGSKAVLDAGEVTNG